MKKVVSLILAIAFVLMLCIGASAEEQKKLKIGCIMDQATTQVIASMGNHMVAKAEELGQEATLVFFDMNVQTMINQIENFISSGYDAILVEPLNSNDGVEALQAAYDAGIAVVVFDTIPNCDYNYTFTGANYEVGYTIGKAAAEWAQENLVANGVKPVIGLVNYPESEFLTLRAEGIEAALKELLPEGEIVITAAGTTEGEGMTAGENFLTAYPELNVVCTINDDSAHGVYQAFSAAGYADAQDRGIFSCDGTVQSKEFVSKGGVFKCVVDLELDYVAECMVDVAVQYLTGAEVTYDKDNYFPMVPLTIDNISEYWTPEA